MKGVGTARWWALGAVQLAVLAVGLDLTVLSVALPTLAGALRASESDLQWFSAGYALVLAAAMLPAGALGDRYGRRRVMVASLALFAAGSAACAAAPTAGAFIAARLALGLAGAGIVVMAMSALIVLFDEEERPRAVAVWAAANFVSLPLGPIMGGWLLSHAWWGWVFLLNVPIALLGLAVVAALVPESRSAGRPGLDPAGVAASSAGLASLTYGLIEAGQRGWGDAAALAPMAGGLAALLAFAWWERRLGRLPGGRPLLDLALFRAGSFTWGVVLVTVGTLALVGVLFTMPQYFQGVVGADALGSGVRLLPLIAGFVAGLAPARPVARLAGARLTIALGFLVLGAALVVGAGTGVGSGAGFVAAWMAACGLGLGLLFATAATAALSELSAERSGVGSAMMQALKNVGAPFGSAILGSALAATYQADLRVVELPPAAASAALGSVFGGVAVARQLHSAALLEAVRAAFVHGMDVSLLVSAGVAGAGVLLALAFMPGRAAARAGGGEPAAREEASAVTG